MPGFLTPEQQFMSALALYIDARVALGVLPVQRLHEKERASITADLSAKVDAARQGLEAQVGTLVRARRRPGI